MEAPTRTVHCDAQHVAAMLCKQLSAALGRDYYHIASDESSDELRIHRSDASTVFTISSDQVRTAPAVIMNALPIALVLQPRRSCRVAAGAAADPRESAVCEIALAQCEWCVRLLAQQRCMPRRAPTLRVRDAVFREAAMAVRRRTTPPTSASVRSTSRFSASPRAASKPTRGSGRQQVRRSRGRAHTGRTR